MTTHPQPPQSPQSFDEFWDKYAVKDDWLYQGTYRTGLKATWDAASAAKQVEIDELKAENERLKRKLQGHNAKLDGQIEATGIAEARYDALAADADALAEAVREMRSVFYIQTHTSLQSGHVRLTTVDRWDGIIARYLEARKSHE